MKKHPIPVLILLTGIFAAFLLGLFIGRNCFRPDITLSALPSGPSHNTAPVIPPEPSPSDSGVVFPLDINVASAAELEELPGIGEALALRIISHREANGPFCGPEELLNVEGIGPGKLEAILHLITTGGNPQ